MRPGRVGQSFEQVGLADEQHEDRCRQRDACFADLFRKTGQLTVQRRLPAAADGGLLGNAACFGGVSDGRDDHHAVAVAHGGAAQQPVGGVGGFRVEERLVDIFRRFEFARKRRLVHAERHRLDEFAVGRHRFARLDDHQIAYDHFAARYFAHRAAAPHLDGLIVVDPVEAAEAAHGVPFEEKAHARGQQNGAQNADGLDEVALDERHRQRQGGGDEQHDDDRVAEFLGQQPPCRIVARRRDDVGPVRGAADRHLLRIETLFGVGDHIGDIQRCYKNSSSGGIRHSRAGNLMFR